MPNWGGTWGLGAGYTLTSTSPAYTFADPKYIRLTGCEVFTKALPTCAGLSQLYGKRSAYPTIEIGIAELTTSANLCADPPVDSTITLTPPSGTAKTCTARLVKDELGQIEPEGEIVRLLTFQASTVLA